jgi:hypothetical protein
MRSRINSDIIQPFVNLNLFAQNIGGVNYTATALKYSWVIFSTLPGHTPQYLCDDGIYRETPSGPGKSHGYYKTLDAAESVWLAYQKKNMWVKRWL